MKDFRSDLQWSHGQSDEPWWEEVYRAAFVGFAAMHDVRSDGWAQRGGIDRQVFLDDGTVLKIDEKARRETWPDFCLEYWSDKGRKVPGWVAKGLTCDFIAYAFVPSRTCYLLPFQSLRSAWRDNRHHWIATYGAKQTPNKGWVTEWVPVPIPVVLDAIQESTKVTWTANGGDA